MTAKDVCVEMASSVFGALFSFREKWWLNSLVVSTTSFINACILFLMMYFWTVNRQTHLKKTKGSAAKFKSGSTQDEEEQEEDEESEGAKTTEALDYIRGGKLKPLKSDMKRRRTWTSINRITMELDDDEEEFHPPVKKKEPKAPLPSVLEEKTPSKRSLYEIAGKVKIFSYLGAEAMKESLKYAEYVDVPDGEALFESGMFDGSLYIVVSGRIKCRFHNFPLGDDDFEEGSQDNGEGNPLAFTSGAGDVVTPLLALLVALVWAEKQKDNPEAAGRPLSTAAGVSAIATAEHTRLIRIPPTCFATILEKFPSDVYRVAQTILARTQRVTLQTLVKTLGLHRDLVRHGPNVWESEAARKVRIESPEWQRIVSTFEGGTLSPADTASVNRDAAHVLSVQLAVPLEEVELLTKHASVVTIQAGETLIRTGFPHDAIYLLLNGTMDIGAMIRRNNWAPSKSPVYFYKYHTIEAGTLLGSLACFVGDASLFEARASRESNEGCTLLKIPKHLFETLLVRHPRTMTTCLELVLNLISPVVHLLNWNSDWMHVEPSEAIAHRGDRCDSIFMVLNGRIRANYKPSPFSAGPGSANSKTEEYGRGKFIGEVGSLTGSTWPCDVYAIRNSELVRVPVAVLVAIIRAYPSAGVHFARIIASQVGANQGIIEVPTARSPDTTNIGSSLEDDKVPMSFALPSYGLNLATIAVVPLVPVDVDGFCDELVTALGEIAPAVKLTKAIARKHLGEKTYRPQNAMHEIKMTRILGDMEEQHRLVVYQADLKYTWWTQLAIKQADCILLLVRAHEVPQKRQVERCLAWAHDSMRVRIELVVISPRDSDDHDNDAVDKLDDWTEQHEWITGNHLIRSPFDHHALDFRRMCRRITGLSVGLALGGGGARGIAHLGVIKALMEAGITVDMVGGTSQGAYIAALYAQSPDRPDVFFAKAREMAVTMSSMWEKLLDLTLPITSMFCGHRFNLGIQKSFGNSRIQHLVLNFFCVSVDIQRRTQVVHRQGLLWKYVRASMSLTGYLPPLSEKGSLLVDGGYLNVVPADVMREEMRARTVIAVDVSPETEREYYEYGNYLSGWWLLWNSWNPFVKTVQVPSMGDISDTLRWVSSDQHRKQIVASTDLHLTPPVGGYGTLEYDKFDEIVEKSYAYAKPVVDDWVRQNPWLVSGKSIRKVSQ